MTVSWCFCCESP